MNHHWWIPLFLAALPAMADFAEAIRFNSDFIRFGSESQAYVVIPSSRQDAKSKNERDKKAVLLEGKKRIVVPNAAFVWPHPVKPPFAITAKVKPTGPNVRFLVADGEIIFNWERKPTELRADFPEKHQALPMSGLLPIDTWSTIEIKVRRTRIVILVNGNERCQILGDFTRSAPVGVYSCFDGKFVLADLQVTPMP